MRIFLYGFEKHGAKRQLQITPETNGMILRLFPSKILDFRKQLNSLKRVPNIAAKIPVQITYESFWKITYLMRFKNSRNGFPSELS